MSVDVSMALIVFSVEAVIATVFASDQRLYPEECCNLPVTALVMVTLPTRISTLKDLEPLGEIRNGLDTSVFVTEAPIAVPTAESATECGLLFEAMFSISRVIC